MGNTNGRQFGSNLTRKDIERLQRRFLRVTSGRDFAQLHQLQQMPELAGNPFVPRIFELFDKDNDGVLTIDDFTRGIEYLGTLSNPDEQVKFAFTMYDLDQDGRISQPEMFNMLKSLISSNMTDTQLEQVVKCTIQEFDKDGDHALNLVEFQALVLKADLQNKLAFTM